MLHRFRGILIVLLVGTLTILSAEKSQAQDDPVQFVINAAYSSGVGGTEMLMDSVCFRLLGDTYNEVRCTVVAPNVGSAAIFENVPLGVYEISVDSAPVGCSSSFLPFVTEITGSANIQYGFSCELTQLKVHVAECSTGVGSAIFEECHDNVLANKKIFIILDPQLVLHYTDESGVISADVLPGMVWIEPLVRENSGYVGAYAFCAEQESGQVLFDGIADSWFSFQVAPSTEVVCDVYELTSNDTGLNGDGGDSGSGDGAGEQPVTLPNTGSGVAAPGLGFNLDALSGTIGLALGFLTLLACRRTV